MRLLSICAITLVLGCTDSGTFDPHGQAQVDASAWPSSPVAVLIEHNPWAMVIGADLPLVEVFDDGTVLRASPEEKRDRSFVVSRLTPSELQEFRTILGKSSEFWDLNEAYDLSPNVSDQPITEIVLGDGSRQKRVAVYAYSVETAEKPGHTETPKSSSADKLPRVFDRLAKTLAGMAPQNSVPWQPRFVEVMIWPYDHSPEEPMPWPSEWPVLGSSDVLPRGDSFSVILPGSELSNIRTYVEQRREMQAVLFDGRKWSISYRLVMPGGAVEKRINAARAAHGA